jgi:hypothetical protein
VLKQTTRSVADGIPTGTVGTREGGGLKPATARSLVNEACTISVHTGTRRQRRAWYRCAGSLVNQAGLASRALGTLCGVILYS